MTENESHEDLAPGIERQGHGSLANQTHLLLRGPTKAKDGGRLKSVALARLGWQTKPLSFIIFTAEV